MIKQQLMILFLILLFSNLASSQIKIDSEQQKIDELVSQLSWKSTRLEYNFMVHIHPNDDNAFQLIKIGKPATDALLAALEDENKARAAHLILYIIWMDSRGVYTVINNGVYKKKFFKKKHVASIEEFYGLKWTTTRGNVISINKNDLKQNADKWRETIAKFRAKLSN